MRGLLQLTSSQSKIGKKLHETEVGAYISGVVELWGIGRQRSGTGWEGKGREGGGLCSM